MLRHSYKVACAHLTRKASVINDKLVPSFSKMFFSSFTSSGPNFLLFSFFECLAGYVFSPAFNKLKTRDFQYTLFHLIFTFLNFENTLELELEQSIFYRIKSCTNTRHN